MVLIVLATLLILGIAFFFTTQGLFSAMIMSLLSVLAAAVALNFYEPLARGLYDGHALYADAIVLTALFGLPLLAARLVVDRVIRGNVVFSQWIDRVGSAVFGMLAGTVIIGVLMIVLQLLPGGASILGYRPFDDSLKPDQSLWPFQPDRFVLALGNKLSVGSLRGERPYATLHRDLLLRLFCDRNRAGLDGRRDADPDALTVIGAYEAPNDSSAYGKGMHQAPANPLLSNEENRNSRVVVVRVAISRTAADEKDLWWRLVATNFRLAYPDGRNFYPVAYLTFPWHFKDTSGMSDSQLAQWRLWAPQKNDAGDLLFTKLGIVRPREKYRRLIVDWVYRLPAKAPVDDDQTVQSPARSQMYLAFRRSVEVPMPKINVQVAPRPPLEEPKPKDPKDRYASHRRREAPRQQGSDD